MDKKVLVIILIISVMINLATMFTVGYFWWTRNALRRDVLLQPPMMRDWQHTRMAKELCLSENQIDAMKKANEDLLSVMQPLREELFKKRMALMSLLQEKTPDRNRADILIREIGDLQVKHDIMIFERLVTMRDILTPEQQQKLGSLLHAFVEAGRPGPHFGHEMPHHLRRLPPDEARR